MRYLDRWQKYDGVYDPEAFRSHVAALIANGFGTEEEWAEVRFLPDRIMVGDVVTLGYLPEVVAESMGHTDELTRFPARKPPPSDVRRKGRFLLA